MDQFAWTKKEALQYIAWIMTTGGIVACFTFFSINPLCKKFKESDVLIFGGFFVMILGRIAHIPYRDELPKFAYPKERLLDNGTMIIYDDDHPDTLGCPQDWCKTTSKLGFYEFLLGYMLTSVGYPIGLTLIQTIFSKVLGPRPQGNWQGLITNAGCLSRITGPIFVIYGYTTYGPLWTFLAILILTFIPMIFLIILKKRLDVEGFSQTKSPKSLEMEKVNSESDKEKLSNVDS